MNRSQYQCGGAVILAKRGNDLPHAKLTPDVVREIRKNRQGLTSKQWAARIGVHDRTIQKVRYFESWRHV